MTLDAQLAQLEAADLVRRAVDVDRGYQFKHALTQDSAYASLLKSQRTELHRRTAQAVEELYPEQLDEFAALLARHYSQAGDAAMRVYASAEAVVHYTRALEVAKRGHQEGEDGASPRALYRKSLERIKANLENVESK
jgi:predicted ATPase